MLHIRPGSERGHFDHGWLNTYHTFSFADYRDPRHMGFRTLRVINEDRVAPGQGFGQHSHQNMEILSYVLEGALAHKDGMGHHMVLRPGEVQRMSAGTGVMHSEYNASDREILHFLQIWIRPASLGLPPSYEQRTFDWDSAGGQFVLVASPDGRERSLTIHQAAHVYVARMDAGQEARLALAPGHGAWIQVVRGTARVNGTTLTAGDGAGLEDTGLAVVESVENTEVLAFDLA